MSKVFRLTPKRIKRSKGLVITSEKSITTHNNSVLQWSGRGKRAVYAYVSVWL